MQKEITTQQIQEKFKEIAGDFVDVICSYTEFKDKNIELALLLNKINSNIQAVILLASKGMINEARIIFRSAFETVVLFEYLIEFPEQMDRYKLDDLISEFKQLFASYKRNIAKKENVIKIYNEIKDRIQNDIKFEKKSKKGIIFYDFDLLEEQLRNFRPLSQKTVLSIQKLMKNNNIHAKYLYFFQFDFYNYNSQICHSRLNTLTHQIENRTPDKILKDIQTLYKDCTVLYRIIFETLENNFQFKYPHEFYDKILLYGEYLGIKVPRKSSLILFNQS